MISYSKRNRKMIAKRLELFTKTSEERIKLKEFKSDFKKDNPRFKFTKRLVPGLGVFNI